MDANNGHDLDDRCRAQCEKPLAEEGYELMAAVFEVHQEMGGGLAEEIYQQSLEIEFETRRIPFKAKDQLRVFYKGRMLETCYIPDFVLHGQIVVELKSVKELATEHEAQLLNYMRITRHPVGYLVNFGPVSRVQWKRFVLSEFVRADASVGTQVSRDDQRQISVH
jgi:GxxExxY protein